MTQRVRKTAMAVLAFLLGLLVGGIATGVVMFRPQLRHIERKSLDSQTDFQLPSGQLWWKLFYVDQFGKASEVLFTYEGDMMQTWFNAYGYALIMLREDGVEPTEAKVELYGQV